MSTFPGSPRLLKGAIVAIDAGNPLASVIVFQYNPQTLTRSLYARVTNRWDKTDKKKSSVLEGAPVESIRLEVEIDATDQLEKGEGTAVRMGIYPQLSALEMLLYPKSASVIAKVALAALGTTQILPLKAPLILFIWGAKRVLPVSLDSFTITEEAYDANLNPIRAKVSIDLQVLTYDDLEMTHPGYYLFLAHQVVKEAMAVVGSVNNLSAVAGGNVKLL